MKKKILMMVLAMTMLAGCGNKETNTTNAPVQEVTENVATEEVVEVDTDTQQLTVDEIIGETLGVPYGEVPEYAKNWTEADYGEFTDETAIVEATPGNWTSGIFTFNGDVVDLSKTFAELKADGLEFVDYDRPEEDDYWFEEIPCSDATISLDVRYEDTMVKSDDVIFTGVSATHNFLKGNEFCGITYGDDFGKYKDILGKPYCAVIEKDRQMYTYRSTDGYELWITVDYYNISEITLSKVQE